MSKTRQYQWRAIYWRDLTMVGFIKKTDKQLRLDKMTHCMVLLSTFKFPIVAIGFIQFNMVKKLPSHLIIQLTNTEFQKAGSNSLQTKVVS
jgi:hypothetical protein